MPIDPSFAVQGAEWALPKVGAPGGTQPGTETGAPATGGFGDILSSSIGSLTKTQEEAAGAARALATGEASDPTSVVLAVERAQLAMQLASQIRTKAVEAAQDIFHTQV
jgi:flagellar hook-basal body complex protein FliE